MDKNIPIAPTTMMVELDALLDTRLATLFHHHPEIAEDALANGYHRRLIDKFGTLSVEAFRELYQARTREIFQHAYTTPILQLIKDFVEKTIKKSVNSPFLTKPKIILNTYPYELSDEEAKVFVDVLYTATNGNSDISVVHFSFDELSPRYVKNNLNYWVMYDYMAWFEYHSVNGKISKTTIPEVTLIAPAIYFKPFEGTEEKAFEIFPELERGFKIFADLSLRPISDFSVLLPSNHKEAEEPQEP